MGNDIETQLFEVFLAEVAFQRKLEKLKMELERLPEYGLSILFKFIDVNNYNYIDENQIKRFLGGQGFKKITTNKVAILSILKRLNKQRKLKVSFNDFSEAISPQSSNLFVGVFHPAV